MIVRSICLAGWVLAAGLVGCSSGPGRTGSSEAIPNTPVSIPPDEARALARVFSFIDSNKLIIAQMRLRELQEETTSDVTRTVIDLALAEIHFRQREDSQARELAGRHVNSRYDELAADANFLMGKIDLRSWKLEEARRSFERTRRIAKDGVLKAREARAKEYLDFTDALILFEQGHYREAKQMIRAVTAPELKSVSQAAGLN